MRYVEEFRDPVRVRATADAIAATATRPWTLMEVCGGQTHAIARFGLEDLLPPGLELLHGPGCPVCVTPLEVLDAACALALRPGALLCTFGDMMRVPGSRGDLLSARAAGADVRVVLSPVDALRLAVENPQREVIFFGVGFETTAPMTALLVEQAAQRNLRNFSLLASFVRVPPALELILSDPENRVQAFLAAGHVCMVAGTTEYTPLLERYRIPIVVTGFEPLDLLQGVLLAVRQLEKGEARLENQYDRAVQVDGNPLARAAVARVFEVADRPWRGLGVVAEGGLLIRAEYARFDAMRHFGLEMVPVTEPRDCRAAEVLQGKIKPVSCEAFGGRCTPDHPLGAPMVSTEGACAAAYRYRRHHG